MSLVVSRPWRVPAEDAVHMNRATAHRTRVCRHAPRGRRPGSRSMPSCRTPTIAWAQARPPPDHLAPGAARRPAGSRPPATSEPGSGAATCRCGTTPSKSRACCSTRAPVPEPPAAARRRGRRAVAVRAWTWTAPAASPPSSTASRTSSRAGRPASLARVAPAIRVRLVHRLGGPRRGAPARGCSACPWGWRSPVVLPAGPGGAEHWKLRRDRRVGGSRSASLAWIDDDHDDRCRAWARHAPGADPAGDHGPRRRPHRARRRASSSSGRVGAAPQPASALARLVAIRWRAWKRAEDPGRSATRRAGARRSPAGAREPCWSPARPRQWPKNVLVFAARPRPGVLATPAVDRSTGARVRRLLPRRRRHVLLNDVLDVEADRRHPTKRDAPDRGRRGRSGWRRASASALLVPAAAVAARWRLAVRGRRRRLRRPHDGLLALAQARRRWSTSPSVASGFVLRAVAGGAAAASRSRAGS